VIVLRLSALGDVIHTIPAVAALRAVHEDIQWVVEAPYRDLVEIVAGVKAIPVRMKQWPRGMGASLKAMRGHDTAIDFQGLIKSAVLGFASGAKTRYGFASSAIREKPALLFTNRKVQVDIRKHVVEQNLELARAAGAGKAEERWDAFPQGGGSAEVVLLPGAGKENKLWPVERWREVAKRTNALVVWGPGEEPLARRISDNLAPPTNLRELAGYLKNAKLVLGADTGPLHLAAALGTKVVGLYGPTNPRRNGPYGQLHHVVDEFARTKLMASITVEQVMNLVERVIAE
jgi:heptosyltransferase I